MLTFATRIQNTPNNFFSEVSIRGQTQSFCPSNSANHENMIENASKAMLEITERLNLALKYH